MAPQGYVMGQLFTHTTEVSAVAMNCILLATVKLHCHKVHIDHNIETDVLVLPPCEWKQTNSQHASKCVKRGCLW